MKKKRIKLIATIIFWSIIDLFLLYIDLDDFLRGKDSLIKLIINLLMVLIIGLAFIYQNVHKLKYLGQYDPEGDDERDKMIEQKTNQQVLKVLDNLMLFGGVAVGIIGALVKNHYLTIVLISIAVFMELVWWLSMILTVIFSIKNYRKY